MTTQEMKAHAQGRGFRLGRAVGVADDAYTRAVGLAGALVTLTGMTDTGPESAAYVRDPQSGRYHLLPWACLQ